jgi:hypothetical protein
MTTSAFVKNLKDNSYSFLKEHEKRNIRRTVFASTLTKHGFNKMAMIAD